MRLRDVCVCVCVLNWSGEEAARRRGASAHQLGARARDRSIAHTRDARARCVARRTYVRYAPRTERTTRRDVGGGGAGGCAIIGMHGRMSSADARGAAQYLSAVFACDLSTLVRRVAPVRRCPPIPSGLRRRDRDTPKPIARSTPCLMAMHHPSSMQGRIITMHDRFKKELGYL